VWLASGSSVSLIWNLRSAACSDEPDHAGLPAAIGQRRVRRLVWLRDHAKQVAAGILKHDEIRTRPVPPGVARRPEVQQPVYLGGLVSRIEIKVDPTPSPRASVSRLKGKIRPLALRITKDHPTTLCWLTRYVVERRLPECDRAIAVKAMNDDGPDLHPQISR